MQEYKVVLTWEAIYDVTDILDYMEAEFGQKRADKFQKDIKEEIEGRVDSVYLHFSQICNTYKRNYTYCRFEKN